MKVIKIREYVAGDMATSYNDGKKCLKDMIKYFDQGEKVVLDFSGINYVIAAFLNPVIGDFILKKGNCAMQFVEIANADEVTISKVKRIKEGALGKLP